MAEAGGKIAAVEKKMDMSLDDIIKANRTRGSKPRAIKKPVGQPRAPLIVSKMQDGRPGGAQKQGVAGKRNAIQQKKGMGARVPLSTARLSGISKAPAGTGRVAALKRTITQKVLSRARGQGQAQAPKMLTAVRQRKTQQAPKMVQQQLKVARAQVQFIVPPQQQQPQGRRKAVAQQQQQQAPKLSLIARMRQQRQLSAKQSQVQVPLTVGRGPQRGPAMAQFQVAPVPLRQRLGVRDGGVQKSQRLQQMVQVQVMQQQRAPVSMYQLPQMQMQQPQVQQQRGIRGGRGRGAGPGPRVPVNLVSQAENPLHLQQLQMQEIEREMRRQREQMALELNKYTQGSIADLFCRAQGQRESKGIQQVPIPIAMPAHGGMGRQGSGGGRGRGGRVGQKQRGGRGGAHGNGYVNGGY